MTQALIAVIARTAVALGIPRTLRTPRNSQDSVGLHARTHARNSYSWEFLGSPGKSEEVLVSS